MSVSPQAPYSAMPALQTLCASCRSYLETTPAVNTVSAKLRELLPTERDPHNSMTFGPRVDPELLLSRLSFSHFAELITIEKQEERAFYEIECVRGAWSVRELKRQIGALYFERSAFSRDPQRLAGATIMLCRVDPFQYTVPSLGLTWA
jgi:hypothetical protein